MARKLRKAIDATHDNCGVVTTTEGGIYVTFNQSVPLAADDLVQNVGWVIAYETASQEGLRIYTSLD